MESREKVMDAVTVSELTKNNVIQPTSQAIKHSISPEAVLATNCLRRIRNEEQLENLLSDEAVQLATRMTLGTLQHFLEVTSLLDLSNSDEFEKNKREIGKVEVYYWMEYFCRAMQTSTEDRKKFQ